MLNIFQYLEKTKGKPIPFLFKLLNNLPLTEDELIYNGNLVSWFSDTISLPDNLTVNGHLDLYLSNIKSLPKNLIINSNLNINSTKISELPDDLIVAGNLWCIDTPLAKRIKKDKLLLSKYKKQVKGKIYYVCNF